MMQEITATDERMATLTEPEDYEDVTDANNYRNRKTLTRKISTKVK